MFLLALLLFALSPNNASYGSTGQHTELFTSTQSHTESLTDRSLPIQQRLPSYPWDGKYSTPSPITKYHFRCKGSTLNPTRPLDKEAAIVTYISDCDGIRGHSLPLFCGQEGVYPCLIELLNFMQKKTQRRVVIFSGHRCPTHNTYLDNSKHNLSSKHQIGAAVDITIEGYEQKPEEIISLIEEYYRQHPLLGKNALFTPLKRWEKEAHGVTTQPWYNKELLIKLYKSNEGRDLDNDHNWPYLCLQVRWDRDLDKVVEYSWKNAFYNFYRY